MISFGGPISIAAGRSRVVDVDVLQALTLAMMMVSCSADADWEVYIDKDVAELPIPAQPTLTTTTALGQIPASTKVYVRVSAVNAAGFESPASIANKSITTGSGTPTNRVAASWTAVTGATGYRVYVGTRPGMESFYGTSLSTSLNIDTIPGDLAGAIPTAADMLVSPLKGHATSVVSLIPITVARRLVIYVNSQTAATAYVTCLAG